MVLLRLGATDPAKHSRADGAHEEAGGKKTISGNQRLYVVVPGKENQDSRMSFSYIFQWIGNIYSGRL